MANNKRSFLLYTDLIHTVDKVPDEIAGKLFKIILEYVNDKDPKIEDLMLQILFEPIKQQLKRDLIKYEGIRESKSKAGIASAEARKKRKEEDQQVLTDVESVEQDSTDSTVSVNVSVSDKVNDINNNTPPVETGECEITSIKKQKPTAGEGSKKSSAKKESFIWDNLLAKINKETGRNFQVINLATRKKYLARIKEGYSKNDINAAIENAPKTDFNKGNNCQYLTPLFFSKAETIDKYSAVSNDSEKNVAPKMSR